MVTGRLSFAIVDWFGVAIGDAKEWMKQLSSFSLSTFLRGACTDSTGVFILPCLKEPNKIKTEVWFYVLMKTTSYKMLFFDHQNKCQHALHVEVSSL
jgi:hypothetical protein